MVSRPWTVRSSSFSFFFINDPATTEIYTLSLHDALPISTKIKRQAARFRIFEETTAGTLVPFVPPAGAKIEWTVELANKKGAVIRDDDPPASPTRPVVQIGRAHV